VPINKAKCYLKVSEKRTYGKSYYTPECEISSVILAMMGKEYGDRVAFTRQDIDFLRDFGCDVQIQGENK
jgi:hypothetical protein